jgi:trehalose-6-phosphate synthase
MADALKRAFDMDEDERCHRMSGMQENVKEQDIFWWVDYYLGAALGEMPKDIRPPREYFPPISVEENWI